MEIIEKIFGYFVLWIIFAFPGISWILMGVIRFNHRLDDPFLIHGFIVLEIVGCIVLLLYVLREEFHIL